MAKLKVDELLRLACIYAETDRQEFLDCIAHCKEDADTIEETKDFLSQLRAYRLKRWGKTKLEAATERMTAVQVAEIVKGRGV